MRKKYINLTALLRVVKGHSSLGNAKLSKNSVLNMFKIEHFDQPSSKNGMTLPIVAKSYPSLKHYKVSKNCNKAKIIRKHLCLNTPVT